MTKCKECKWWDDTDIVDREFYDIEERQENGEPEPPEIRKCKCPKIWFQYEYDEKGNMKGYCEEGGAMYWDGSGYHAAFGTTVTFGCACGEPKPFIIPARTRIKSNG